MALNLSVYLPDRCQWATGLLSSIGLQPRTESSGCSMVFDELLQGEQQDNSYIQQYLHKFQCVILFSCETRPGIQSLCKQIDFDQIILITTGHLEFDLVSARVIKFENFFYCLQQIYSLPEMFLDLKDLRPHDIKPQYFDALLGISKPHRDFVHHHIQNHNANQFYKRYNFKPCQNTNYNSNFEWPTGAVAQNPVNWTGASVEYLGFSIPLSHIIPVEIYNQTAYSIVTESLYDNDFVFLTEKTAKCILAQRLFVMFAGPGYLKHLKSLGFQTFDCVIDESYDQETDNNRRWQQAWDQVEYLCSQPQQHILEKIAPIVKHNYNHFVNSQWNYENKLKNLLKDS